MPDQIGGKWKIQFIYLLVIYKCNAKKKKKDIWEYNNENI